jgi:NAD-dependent SIR2 family protein deacetylase
MTDADAAKIVNEIRSADALVVTAGAGMGVDSGLPDFRGTAGFWKAYPPFAKLGFRFEQLANPRWFREDPNLAWGFYGHRLHAYRDTTPHSGFAILKRWIDQKKHGGYVYTSNVDGQFQKAGFDPQHVVECHGSIHLLQCLESCGIEAFSADDFDVAIDSETMRAPGPLPKCPNCGALARPNILMFGDSEWDERPFAPIHKNLQKWCRELRGAKMVVIECGAGTAIPSVRIFSETLVGAFKAFFVRVNVREPKTSEGIGIAVGAKDFLETIDRML